MYAEAVDLVLRAWTEPGPFEHYGKHWKLKYVNPWPRPLQQPHPPIWIPGAGSKETIEYVAAHRWSYMGIPYFHIDFFQRNFDLFRKSAEKNGYTSDPEQLGWLLPIYVAETDEQAWAEYEQHLWYFAHNLLRGLTILPPGYTSAQSIAVISKAKEKFLSSVTTRKQVEEGAYAVVGSPATVRDRLKDHIKRLGVGNLLGLFQLGSLPADLTKKNMMLFAREVLPTLRRELAPSS
jgi:alkanesulfonate monooxygenase SsuD/methylene tetrahydromethanopterin reductase-like flavin-dependent oxidoreductase (luciferase family)